MKTTAFLLLAVAIECVVLLILGILKKLTRREFAICAVISIALAGIAFVQSQSGKSELTQQYDIRERLYMAVRLIQEDEPAAALDALAPITDSENEKLDVTSLRALAYNLSDARRLAGMYLERCESTESETTGKLYAQSLMDTKVDNKTKKNLCKTTIAAIGVSEEERERWDAEIPLRFLDVSQQKKDKDSIAASETADEERSTLEIRKALLSHDYAGAYEKACNDAKQGDYLADIIVSQMYALNYDGRTLGDDDAEYDELLKRLTKSQVAAVQAGQEFNENVPGDDEYGAELSKEESAYEAALADYRMAQKEIDEAAAKRSIKYILACEPWDEESRSLQSLQLGYLYYRISDYDQARQYLNTVFTSPQTTGSAMLTQLVWSLCDSAVAEKDGDGGNDFSVAYTNYVNSLYDCVFPDLDDSGYRDFLRRYLKDLLGTIVIDSVNTSMWPEVSVLVHATNPDIDMANDLLLKEAGNEVSDVVYEQRSIKDHKMSICYVVDVSGSMEGKSIADAKEAVRSSTARIDEGMKIGLVSFSNDSRTECGLTTSSFVLAGAVSRLNADGLTNIPSGIKKACGLLKEESGGKAIILLSDGYDTNPSELPDSIGDAISLDVPIYTVGLEGCDKDYLKQIAEDTDGTFTYVADSSDLTDIYESIRNTIRDSFILKFTAQDSALPARIIDISQKSGQGRARKTYLTKDTVSEDSDYSQIEQKSGFYREIGGTKEGGK